MLEKLFRKSILLMRHEQAPFKKERERYLEHCERQGYTLRTLRAIEGELFWVVQKVPIDCDHGVTETQIKDAARGWRERRGFYGQKITPWRTRIRFIGVARRWLRFLGYLREPEQRTPCGHVVDSYRAWMENERGFTPETIRKMCSHLRQFLVWYGEHPSLSAVRPRDIDAFLAMYGTKGACRVSVKAMADALKAFFKYAGSQGWCSTALANTIQGPRIFRDEGLPKGPSWQDVQRLIASMETNRPTDIRNRALVMLCAVYGFRAAEVLHLKLEDIDWDQRLLSVTRVKRRVRQEYPLIPLVGNALIRYLREVRPQSSHRELFLTLTRPVKPLSQGALHHVTYDRMKQLGISAPHRGPHSLRHACAARLVAEGLSFKEIGDHLGHRSPAATRIYAKVDLAGLREVAAFDLGGLI